MYGSSTATVQKKTVTNNAIGEGVETWSDAFDIFGFLDYQGGGSDYVSFDAKVQDTTHLFICDYNQISGHEDELKSEDCRIIHNGMIFDILYVDDPMKLHKHCELYLKYVGIGQGV